MMASTLSTTPLDLHHLTLDSHRRLHNPRSPILCNSKSPNNLSEPTPKTPSLADQLKPLSATVLPAADKNHPQILSKPKSIWVNPTKPRRAVVDPHRQRRSQLYDNPHLKQLKIAAAKLNDCDASEGGFAAIVDELPRPITRGNALVVLNNLRPWKVAFMFFNWLKTQDSVPMETIFYNVVMKSLRFGKQFSVIEELAEEMVRNDVMLDNITYSTIISSAKKCRFFDKAVDWFERMYKTGLMPDEVTYCAVLDVYAQLGKVEEVVSLYERARASGWNPDVVAFSVLGKMFGEAGDYDGISYVFQEMKVVGVKPNVAVYNTLIEALGKAGKPGLAKSLFEEMIKSGLTPSEKTLTVLVKIYGKERWGFDAMDLWEQMKANKWPMDFILYNSLLSMCADVGLEEQAEELFQDMKESGRGSPDAYSYTSMLKLYGSGGKDDMAMELFHKMCETGVEINVMGCTCLIQCLGKAGRIEDLVRVFNISLKSGVRPDDRLCGCLLSVVALCDKMEDVESIFSCLQLANPKIASFVKLMEGEKVNPETLKTAFKGIISDLAVDTRRPICNCFIDICRKRNVDRAHDLLYLGTLFGLYPGLHKKTTEEWCLDVRSLSVGAAHTALEEWMATLLNLVQREEVFPEVLIANAGLGNHRFSQGLGSAMASRVKELSLPFTPSEEKSGCFVATNDDIVSWAQSILPSAVAA